MNVGELEKKLIKELKHDRKAYTVCAEKHGKCTRAKQTIGASTKACGNTGRKQKY